MEYWGSKVKDNEIVKAVEEMKRAGVKVWRDKEWKYEETKSEKKLMVLCTKKEKSIYQKIISLEQK